jgi:hypothetical protein
MPQLIKLVGYCLCRQRRRDLSGLLRHDTSGVMSAVKSLIAVMWLTCFAALSTVLGSFGVFQMGQKN